MERLRNHRDFVSVLKRRKKTASKDIVVHYACGDVCHAAKSGVDSGAVPNFRSGNVALIEKQPSVSSAASTESDALDTVEMDYAVVASADVVDSNSGGSADVQMSRRRLGLAVSKAVGNAVVRNSVKRRFRVLAREYESLLPQSCDVVMRAKPSAARASFSSLREQVEKLFANVSRETSGESR